MCINGEEESRLREQYYAIEVETCPLRYVVYTTTFKIVLCANDIWLLQLKRNVLSGPHHQTTLTTRGKDIAKFFLP